MEMLSIGQRVRYYRKILNISQKELADSKVSSNLISLIERGRVPLSTVTASILVDNINRISEQRGLELHLSIRDLLMSEQDYIKKICKDRFTKVRNEKKIQNVYEELLEMVGKYKESTMKAIVEQQAGEKFFSLKQYENAINHYGRFLEFIKCSEEYIVDYFTLFNIGISYNKTGKYQLAIKYLVQCYKKIEHKLISGEVLYDILYTISLSYYKLGKYKEMSENLEKIFCIKGIDDVKKNEVLLLKVNLYLKLEKHDEALKLYREVMDIESDDIETMYNNIEVALDKTGTCNQKKEKINSILYNDLDRELPQDVITFIRIAEKYKEKGLYKNAVNYYEIALNNALKTNEMDISIQCFKELYFLFSIMNRVDLFDKYIINIVELVNSENINSKSLISLIVLILDYFLERGKYGEAKEFINILKRKG
jgi:tetratricopeptide (TPR) repeat protein